KCLGLKSYLRSPGDGRAQARIPAAALLWALLMGALLRRAAFAGIEALVGSRAGRALGVSQSFGDDALRYFTERLSPAPTRAALASVLRRAKRNKAFEGCHFVGLALDGTTAGRRRESPCRLCRPYHNAAREVVGYRHHLVLAAVLGADLTLPLDVEPYGPGDSEYAAGQRLLRRVRASVSTIVTATWSRLTGSPISPPATSAAVASTRWPRAAGKSRTRASMTLRTATVWNTSATTIPTACSSSGCSPAWPRP